MVKVTDDPIRLNDYLGLNLGNCILNVDTGCCSLEIKLI